MSVRILGGHVLDRLAELPDESVHCCVCSPPYYGLRDYGIEPQVWGDGWCGSLGLEPTLDLYLDHMVEICREIRRVLRKDGTFWMNLGDSYAGSWGSQSRRETPATISRHSINNHPKKASHTGSIRSAGLKPKDLMLVPVRLAIRLQDDGGWWVRSDIAWCKRAPMPESCTDRPTAAWEHVFLLTKSGAPTFWTHRDHAGSRAKPAPDYRWIDKDAQKAIARALALGLPVPDLQVEYDEEPAEWRNNRERWSRINLWAAHDYFYDAEAVKEDSETDPKERYGDRSRVTGRGAPGSFVEARGHDQNSSGGFPVENPSKRNMRNSWLLGPEPFPSAHFAVFPTEIPRRAILAGTSEKGVCPKCAAPWARIVKKSGGFIGKDGGWGVSPEWVKDGVRPSRADSGDGSYAVETIGWQSTCSCDAGDPMISATVLDPFGGAGTTGLVADQLRRDAILIELNPEYAAMAERRIHADNSLFSEIAAE